MFSLGKDCKIVRVSNKVAAGTSSVDSSRADMTGFDSVIFLAAVDTSLTTATLQLIAKSNAADSTSSSTTEVTGTTITDSGGNQANQDFAITVHRPQNRYAYVTAVRGVANLALNAIYAILFNASKGPLPVTQPATVSANDIGGPNA
jgi:hypothetical protein